MEFKTLALLGMNIRVFGGDSPRIIGYKYEGEVSLLSAFAHVPESITLKGILDNITENQTSTITLGPETVNCTIFTNYGDYVDQDTPQSVRIQLYAVEAHIYKIIEDYANNAASVYRGVRKQTFDLLRTPDLKPQLDEASLKLLGVGHTAVAVYFIEAQGFIFFDPIENDKSTKLEDELLNQLAPLLQGEAKPSISLTGLSNELIENKLILAASQSSLELSGRSVEVIIISARLESILSRYGFKGQN